MKYVFLLSIAAAIFATAIATSVHAMSAGNIENLQIVGHHFTTRFASKKQQLTQREPAKARYLVLKFQGEIPRNGEIFCADFILKFEQQGDEDRSQCRGVGLFPNDDYEVGFSESAVGRYSHFKRNAGKVIFALVFSIGDQVSSIEVLRPGAAPLLYNIGRERAYRIVLLNNDTSSRSKSAEDALTKGGYNIRNGKLADKERSGVTIRYSKGLDGIAREISSRLMLTLNELPELVEAQWSNSAVDVLVWIGHKEAE